MGGQKTADWEDEFRAGAGRNTGGVLTWAVVYRIEYLEVIGLWFYVSYVYPACAFFRIICLYV